MWLLIDHVFGLLCDTPHRFPSQGGSFACTLTCLCMVNLRVTSGATPAFSTNRSSKCVYSMLTFWTSLMQATEGRQTVDQGGHGTGKTGNLVISFSRQGKHREFKSNTGKICTAQGKNWIIFRCRFKYI